MPIGTPLYRLQPGSDWVAVRRPQQRPVDVTGLFRTVLGRDLTPAERRLLTDVTTVATAEGGGSGAGTPSPPASTGGGRRP